ncbi:DUF3147 family protein [Streptosporangium sp. NPDC004379]|uniref:DUF3147 family protein n=1 Tax=Streptosporangium sp. NPDC004379 TaxID=3366189 RepID=UPI0036A1BC31
MGLEVVKVLLKAAAGGLFVLLFAALAEAIAPKRLAGVFSAAPSVALGGMLVTAGLSGVSDVRQAALGMAVGAIAFVVYCLVGVPLLKRWGAWKGSAAALGVWLVAAVAGYLVVWP